MTFDQATTLLAQASTINDAIMFASGTVCALIFATTWRG